MNARENNYVLPPNKYIYIYVEIIDCGQSDNMIEICGKLQLFTYL